jgi:hypothetical protein
VPAVSSSLIGPAPESLRICLPVTGLLAAWCLGRASGRDTRPVSAATGASKPLENIRDVTFGEDASAIHARSGPQVMATLRNLSIGIFKPAGHTSIAATPVTPPASWPPTDSAPA